MRSSLFATFSLGMVLQLGCSAAPLEEEELDPAAADQLAQAGPLHSAMTAEVIAHVQGVLAAGAGRRDVFAKVGDSITVDSNFLGCFEGRDLSSGARADLEPARAFFDAERIGARGPFGRDSLAAKVGQMASWPLRGSPSPLDAELAVMQPAFAVVMYGTNDTWEGSGPSFRTNLSKLVDALLARNVVPLLSTIPPRRESRFNLLVPGMNAIVKSVAESRKVPWVDLWQTLVGLPGYGLAGDGVHPKSARAGACAFDAESLRSGTNQRNRVTLEALDRLQRFALGEETPEEAPPMSASPLLPPVQEVGVGERCTVGTIPGICQDVGDCTGTPTPGHCPGPTNVQCCTH